MSDALTLTINGQVYTDWTEVRVTRSLRECTSSFDIAVSERWGALGQPWQIRPFDIAVVKIGDDTVLTGYVDEYLPSFDANAHSVRITGRSKTCDLVDCMPDVGAGEFTGAKLDAVARALCAPFGIGVVVQCDVGDPLPDATLEKIETAYAFLEKFARLRAVILTDDENGNLVLTQAGSTVGAGALTQGDNVLSASARLSGAKRFQTYVVLSQTPEAFDGDDAAPANPQVEGSATDPGCPRPRRFAEMADNPADDSQAKARAQWRALHNLAEGTEATVTVMGWRQPDDTLWKTNNLAPVKSPFLQLDRELLIGSVSYHLDESGGRRTEMTLAPRGAYMPEPDPKGFNGSSAAVWHEDQGIKGK